MKTLISKRFFILTSLLILICASPTMAQETAKTGIFDKISGWVSGGLLSMAVAFIGGIFAKKGWSAIIKSFAHKTAEVSKEVGEFFTDLSAFSGAVDNAIKEDGKIDQNSIAEVIAAGKTVIAEGKDVIISIKPKT